MRGCIGGVGERGEGGGRIMGQSNGDLWDENI